MTSPAASDQSLRLPWLALGPRSQGRNYGVTARTEGLRLGRVAENRLEDFCLALAAWADVVGAAAGRTSQFSCFFQLGEGEPWLLAKASFEGRGGLGTIAVAQGVLLGAEIVSRGNLRPHALLPQLPEPVLGGAPPPPLSVPLEALVRPPRAQLKPGPLGLLADALHSYAMRIENEGPESNDEILAVAMDSKHAPEAVIGWCGTGALNRNGAFDPATAFNLIVHETGDGVARPPRLNARVRGGVLVWSDVPETPARTIWRVLGEHLYGDNQASWPRHVAWRPEYENWSAVEMVRLFVDSPDGDLNATIEVFVKSTDAAADLEGRPLIQADLRLALATRYYELIPPSPADAAVWFDVYLAILSRRLDDVAPMLTTVQVSASGALPYLNYGSIHGLRLRGLVTNFARNTLSDLVAARSRSAAEQPIQTETLAALLEVVFFALEAMKADLTEDSYRLAPLLLEEAAARSSAEFDGVSLRDRFKDLLRRLVCDCGDKAHLALRRGIAREVRMIGATGNAKWKKARKAYLRLAADKVGVSRAGLVAGLESWGSEPVSPWGKAA